MEAVLFTLLGIGLLVGVAIALASASTRNARLAERLDHTERELGQAREGFQNLAARLWYLERAFSELHRTAARVAAAPEKKEARLSEGAAVPGAVPAHPPGWFPKLGATAAAASAGPATTGSAAAEGSAAASRVAARDAGAASDAAVAGEGQAAALLADAGAGEGQATVLLADAAAGAGQATASSADAAPAGAEHSTVSLGEAAAAASSDGGTLASSTSPAAAPADGAADPTDPSAAPADPTDPTATTPPNAALPNGALPNAGSAGGPQPTYPVAPEEPPRAPIEWERWIGVRGAAALGAGILVIAALYFFKYSLEQGLISPSLRVVMGIATGIACIGGSERTRRGNVVLANWLGGAGIAILYTAFWAARSVYGLIGTVPAFGLMIAVTVGCVFLALRHKSLVIAILGLLGGFVTPLALSSGEDHPIGLFGYLLLLDAALIAVSRARRWPVLASMSLFGTWLYQVVWITQRMDAERLWLGIAILVLFAIVFGAGVATAANAEDHAPGSRSAASQPAAILVPFGFGIYFGLRSDLGPHLYPIGLMLCLLTAAACWVGRMRRAAWIPLGAAFAGLAVVFAWLVRHDPSSVAIEVLALLLVLPALFHVLLEIGERRPDGAAASGGPGSPAGATASGGPAGAAASDGSGVPASAAASGVPASAAAFGGRVSAASEGSVAAAVASLGAMFLLFVAGGYPSCVSPWPWLAGWVVLSGLTLRHAGFAGREPLHMGLALLFGLGLPALHGVHESHAGFPDPVLYFGVCAAAALVLLGVSVLRRTEAGRRWSSHAAAMCALLLLIEPLAFPLAAPPAVLLGAILFLAVLALIAATRLGSGGWVLGAMVATAFVQTAWSFLRTDLPSNPAVAWTALVGLGLSTVLFTVWPLLTGRRFANGMLAWRAAALAGPAWFGALYYVWTSVLGDGAIGLLPTFLGLLSLGAAMWAQRREELPEATRRAALSWLGATAVFFATVAIPLQFRNEAITLGWALEGVVLLALFRAVDHAGLKYTGLALLAVVTVRLVLNPAVLTYHPKADLPVLNWLLYTYGVPAACLLAGWRTLRDIEVERLRIWEKMFFQRPVRFGATACAFAAVVVMFAWLNLTILDGFAVGRQIDLVLVHEPARDLTLSIAWALYALVLLALGMRRSNAPLRWASLVLVLVTVGKVFLYDLGHLEDLYRVASLVGLALSLILISVTYQRFVFGKGAAPRAP